MRSAGQTRKEWGRFAVEWHKKFAIPAACLVFGLLGLALSLGSKKEARSSAFALSIGVIFAYYVLIRLGEQAGDTGMLSPFVSMWAANLALGAVALTLLRLNHREAAFDPLDPAHYLAFVPKVRRQRAARPAPAERSVGLGAARKPVVVVRIPRLTLRFPSLLDRYIAASWAANVALVLVAFMSIFFLGEFMDLIDDIQQHSVKGKVLLRYYAFHVWWIGFTVAPVAVLVGVLVTLGLLARHNEITAMKAGGISVYRAAGPVLGMGLLASLLLYGMQEWMLPVTNKAAALDFNVIKGRPRAGVRPVRPALGAGERRALLQLRLHRGAQRPAPERGGGARDAAASSRSTASPSTTWIRRPGSCARGSSRAARPGTAPPGPTSWSAAGAGRPGSARPFDPSRRSACG